MSLTLTLLICIFLNNSNPGDSFEQKSFAGTDRHFSLTTAGLPEINGCNKVSQTIVFQSIKSETHKIEGLIKNINPIIQAKAQAVLLESFDITNIRLIVLFVHSP